MIEETALAVPAAFLVPCRVVYGDTDSVMVHFPGRDAAVIFCIVSKRNNSRVRNLVAYRHPSHRGRRVAQPRGLPASVWGPPWKAGPLHAHRGRRVPQPRGSPAPACESPWKAGPLHAVVVASRGCVAAGPWLANGRVSWRPRHYLDGAILGCDAATLRARPLQQREVAALRRPGGAAGALVPRGGRALGARPLQQREVAAEGRCEAGALAPRDGAGSGRAPSAR